MMLQHQRKNANAGVGWEAGDEGDEASVPAPRGPGQAFQSSRETTATVPRGGHYQIQVPAPPPYILLVGA